MGGCRLQPSGILIQMHIIQYPNLIVKCLIG